MTRNYGAGISRVLSPDSTQFVNLIWQQDRPPLDAEFTLLGDLLTDWQQKLVLRGTPSGWLSNDTNPSEDILTDPTWSNWFRFGRQRLGELASIPWAVVNGWLIPVTGTRIGALADPGVASTWNRILLEPPPNNSNDTRADFVFLEVWLARVPSTPSTLNKPAPNAIYRYGNVEGGYTYLPDDTQDPAIGFETTQRVQLQYRIRSVSSLIGLTLYPDGFDSTVRAQGAAASPTSHIFENMRETLGDPGLWRAGRGLQDALGSVDGYVYAIPMFTVFRRNGVAWTGDPSVNLNGAFNRNQSAISREDWKTFAPTVTLAAAATASDTSLTLAPLANDLDLPLPNAASTGTILIRVGDELMTYTAITPGVGGTWVVNQLTRGVNGSKAEAHKLGTPVQVISGRPDGLFADQVAKTDILDLRHIVRPNGFDYHSVLRSNLDKLLRGELRANWKRTGGGTQGVFVACEDKIGTSAGSGVGKMDAPDGIRQVFSDAVAQQQVLAIVRPSATPPSPGDAVAIQLDWGLNITASTNTQATANQFGAGDKIQIPIAQFKGGLGTDQDQVMFLTTTAGLPSGVSIHVEGREAPLVQGGTQDYTVGFDTAEPGPSSNLVITFVGGSDGTAIYAASGQNVYITFNIQYGPGRGLTRRPDSIHGITMLSNTGNNLLLQQVTQGSGFPLRVAWAPTWSRYRRESYKGVLPTTAEAYADLGSKTVILTPLRKMNLVDNLVVLDGATVNDSHGLMPKVNLDGTDKWTTTDPLDLFCGHAASSDAKKNMYVVLPRALVPGWGAYHLPVQSTGTLAGINFLLASPQAATTNDNYVSYGGGSGNTFAVFSTHELTHLRTSPSQDTLTTYNATNSVSFDFTYAGMRIFTDTRGLGRKGLQLPPFYGIARLFGVYEARDYAEHGTPVVSSTRAPNPLAVTKNLLRQNFNGPVFWVEIDSDGDSTFVINADALDLTKATAYPIDSFEQGRYVIEASLFGFDRGAFDLTKPFRLVLSQALANRATSLTTPINTAPQVILPAPIQSSDSAVIDYSRTPYQGDAFGTKTNYLDLPYGSTGSPLTSQAAHQLVSTPLDETSLVQRNPKSLEVLASITFSTSLGTGRLSADLAESSSVDIRNVGYEYTDPSVAPFPPVSSNSPRPTLRMGALESTDPGAGSAYLGCTERLPLGALWRDKDFRGGSFLGTASNALLVYHGPANGCGYGYTGLARTPLLEQSEVSLAMADVSSGQPGDIVVHVDGESINYALNTSYRTVRGGAIFSASGSRPGGEFISSCGVYTAPNSHTNVLAGHAMLVRNTVSSKGSYEVSAGDELMMLIVTTAHRLDHSEGVPAMVAISANGFYEGHSASDLYRIEGRPLVVDHVKNEVDLDTISLSRRV